MPGDAGAALAPLDEFDFHHTLQRQPGLSLVIFTARGCAACRHWKRLLGSYRYPGLVLFEVDAERSLALTREFELFHLPALFLYRDGQYHCPLQSAASHTGLTAAIEMALRLPAQEAP